MNVNLDTMRPPPKTLEINAGASPGIYIGMDLAFDETNWVVVRVDGPIVTVELNDRRARY